MYEYVGYGSTNWDGGGDGVVSFRELLHRITLRKPWQNIWRTYWAEISNVQLIAVHLSFRVKTSLICESRKSGETSAWYGLKQLHHLSFSRVLKGQYREMVFFAHSITSRKVIEDLKFFFGLGRMPRTNNLQILILSNLTKNCSLYRNKPNGIKV